MSGVQMRGKDGWCSDEGKRRDGKREGGWCSDEGTVNVKMDGVQMRGR